MLGIDHTMVSSANNATAKKQIAWSTSPESGWQGTGKSCISHSKSRSSPPKTRNNVEINTIVKDPAGLQIKSSDPEEHPKKLKVDRGTTEYHELNDLHKLKLVGKLGSQGEFRLNTLVGSGH